MRLPLLASALALFCGAAQASAEVYDCSRAEDRRSFQELASRAASDARLGTSTALFGVLHGRRVAVESDPGGAQCTIEEWCLYRRATIEIKGDSGTRIARAQSAPPSACTDPWEARCDGPACRHRTEPLSSSDQNSRAVFDLRPDGTVIVADPGKPRAPWFLLNPYPEDSGPGHFDFEGINFAWRGAVYKAQFGTRFVFRNAGSGDQANYVDTGATLDPEVFGALCLSAGPVGCAERGRANCAGLGLTRRGRHYADARGGRWDNDSAGECRPRNP